ncbi:MAG: GNAT family N-acetyltransferase [Methanocalculaceae archaeon]|jgi:ribosomal protein S18 acetylase RimI-like enzyme|nr:GNAT family N-acetyltransferase [Methanocalculaceae archaeon]
MQHILRKNNQEIVYLAIRNWQASEIIDLYRAGGWWDMGWNPASIAPLIHDSFLFVIALDTLTDHAIGMGRIIADGSSDGYVQDIAVLHTYRERGIGTTIAVLLRSLGVALGLSWLGLISAPGKENLYKRAGFFPMENYTPMNLDEERSHGYHDAQ